MRRQEASAIKAAFDCFGDSLLIYPHRLMRCERTNSTQRLLVTAPPRIDLRVSAPESPS